jgi:phospholipid/cholesterol/gamma-HCH transport system substrate-binding protein
MDDRKMKWRVGLVVIATVFISIVLVAAFSDMTSIGTGTYRMYVRFQDAPGISEGSPVRKSGILIGRVEETEFAKDGEGVIVTLKIQDNVKLRANEICRIKANLLGDSVLEFVSTGDKTKANQFYHPDEYLDGTVAGNPMESFANLEDDLSVAAASVTKAGDGIRELADNLNSTFGDDKDQFRRILNKLETSLTTFTDTMNNIDGVIGDKSLQTDLRRTLKEMPELAEEVRKTFDTLQVTVASADRNLRNLEGLTGPLGERGDELVGKIDSTVSNLDELLSQFAQFGKQLNDSEGSLGKLVKDPELYQNLNKAARNIECLTSELRPIVRDARAFSDKIARHPELLGVRGAIQKSSGIK